MPISVVPPSPPWAMTRMSSRPLAFRAAEIPALTAATLPNRECIHGSRQAVCGYGVVNTSRHPVALAAMILPSAARMCGIDCIARAQRFATTLAGTVAGVEGVADRSTLACHRAPCVVQQSVAHGKGAGLVELDPLLRLGDVLSWAGLLRWFLAAGHNADVAQNTLRARPRALHGLQPLELAADDIHI